MNDSNAMLADRPDEFESITMRSGASLSFAIGNDPEMMMSGLLEPEDWSWIN